MPPYFPKTSSLFLGLMLTASPTALFAQNAGNETAQSIADGAVGEDFADDIIVTGGAKQRGAVVGDIEPEQQLSAADIRSYGVSSISELIAELAPQTNAAGGKPVVLLNGKRIASFSEIRDIPSEAIARVDILPEDVSLSYGYSPNQKVVNIVLRSRFRAVTGEVRGGIATAGGGENGTIGANLLRIQGDNRISLDIKYSAADHLLESERDILPTQPRNPFSLSGNITAPPGSGSAEIDAMLSALAGYPVTAAAVPLSAASGRPALSDFLIGANAAEVSDLGRYRTLRPATENLAINAGIARTLPGDVSGSLNIRVELTDSDALQGLSSASLAIPGGSPFSPFSEPVQLYRYLGQAGPLGQSIEGRNVEIGMMLSGDIKPWRWTFIGNYENTDTRTATDRGVDTGGIQAALLGGDASVSPFGSFAPGLIADRLTDRARAQSSGFTGDLLFTGPLFSLPAGQATSSVTFGIATNDFKSRSVRASVEREAAYSRDIVNGKASIDLPIASRRKDVLGALGDLSLNANVEAQQFSDFGTLIGYGYGLRWTPIDQIRIIGSVSETRIAPTGQEVNNPTVITPNIPVFDYRTGETVFVSQIGGGNSALDESKRQQIRLGVTVKPFDKPDLTFTAQYKRNRTDNPIMAFPEPTPQIEAAFSDRFIRDADGRLLQIDGRPINFAQARSSEIRWGVNFSKPLKSSIQKQFEAWRAAGSKPEDRPAGMPDFGNRRPRPEGETHAGAEQGGPERGGAERAGAERGGERGGEGAGNMGGPRGGGGGFGRGGRGGGGGRLQFALYHNWSLENSILIAPGLPKLDLLNGDAIGSGGGEPRHKLEAQAGYSNNGIGVRMSGNWQSATHVNGALGVADSRLRFSDLATVDLRIFANLGQMPQLVRNHPFLRGSRVTFSVENLFDGRQHVTTDDGATPLRYQPHYLDPMGRRVMISFRKLFS